MNPELQQAFLMRYSFLLHKQWKSIQSRRNIFYLWGFQCGPGWVPLLIEFCETVESMDLSFVEVRQIKEKFNALRIYVSAAGADEDALEDYIEKLEIRSRSVCELCSKQLKDGKPCNHDGLTMTEIDQKMLSRIQDKEQR